MKNIIKNKLTILYKNIKRSFKKIVPVYIPVFNSDLLQNRFALITGGTKGIGFEIAKAFINNGASVIITGRDISRVNNAIEDLKRFKKNEDTYLYGIELDNTDIKSFNKKFNEIIGVIGNKKIDIFVNNAGVNTDLPYLSLEENIYDLIMNTNLKGPYFLTQILARYMKPESV